MYGSVLRYNPLRVIALFSLAFTVLFASVDRADAGAAKRSIARANAELNRCATLPKEQRYDCVSDAFSDVSTSIARFRNYFKASRIVREAANKVGATRIISVAISALEKARKSLLRSVSGVEKRHQGNYKDLSKLMARAKSVLRA